MKEIEGEERKERIKNIKCESCRLFFQHHHDISNNLSAEFDNSDILNCKICKNYHKHECKKIEEPMTEKNKNYGTCPECKYKDHPNNYRERTINGNTICGNCNFKSYSSEWKKPMTEEEEDKYWGELALEAKKEPSIGIENTMKFLTRNKKIKIDFTKPIEVVDTGIIKGNTFPARVICTNINDISGDKENRYTAVVAFQTCEQAEWVMQCTEYGDCKGKDKEFLKVRNIPEKPTLDLHVGEIYKANSGHIIVITAYDVDLPGFIGYDLHLKGNLGFDNGGKCKSLWDAMSQSLIEKLGDIRDLSPVIKEALK